MKRRLLPLALALALAGCGTTTIVKPTQFGAVQNSLRASEKGAANGLASTNSSDQLVQELRPGQVKATQIESGTITATQLKNEAVTPAKLAVPVTDTAGECLASKGTSGTELQYKSCGSGGGLSAEAVTTEDLAKEAVTGGTTSASKIAHETVQAYNLAGAAVTEAKLSSEAVSAGKIASESVTSAKIASALNDPAASSYGLRKLGTGSTEALPGNTTITEAQIASEAVSKSKLTSSLASELTGKLAAPTIHAVVTTSTTLAAAELTPVEATSGALTEKLPEGDQAGTLIAVEKADSSANAVTVEGQIRSATKTSTLTLKYNHEELLLEANGSGYWYPIAGHLTVGSLEEHFSSVPFEESLTVTTSTVKLHLRKTTSKAVFFLTLEHETEVILEEAPASAPAEVIIHWKENGTGGYKVKWPSGTKWVGGSGNTEPAFSTAANEPNVAELEATEATSSEPYGYSGPEGKEGKEGAKGVEGKEGPPQTFKGQWVSGTTYKIGEAVYSKGSEYVALKENVGKEPPEATNWGIAAKEGAAGSSSGVAYEEVTELEKVEANGTSKIRCGVLGSGATGQVFLEGVLKVKTGETLSTTTKFETIPSACRPSITQYITVENIAESTPKFNDAEVKTNGEVKLENGTYAAGKILLITGQNFPKEG